MPSNESTLRWPGVGVSVPVGVALGVGVGSTEGGGSSGSPKPGGKSSDSGVCWLIAGMASVTAATPLNRRRSLFADRIRHILLDALGRHLCVDGRQIDQA